MSTVEKRQDIELREIGDVTVATIMVENIIEDFRIRDLGQRLFELVDIECRAKIILNFKKVKFVSAMMFSKLITLKRKIRARRGRLILCCIDPEIINDIKRTKLIQLFEIVDTEEDGLATF